MNFTESVTQCFNKYADFNGTARRSEYWWFSLFYTVGYCGLLYVNLWLGLAFLAATIVPMLAVTWRRLHDTDRSGAFFFISLVPFVGGIILFVFLVQDSRPNRYGEPASSVV